MQTHRQRASVPLPTRLSPACWITRQAPTTISWAMSASPGKSISSAGCATPPPPRAPKPRPAPRISRPWSFPCTLSSRPITSRCAARMRRRSCSRLRCVTTTAPTTVTDNRYKQGIAAATDVEQADTLRQNARAQLAAVRLQRAQLAHAIAVLVGEPPSQLQHRFRVRLQARRLPSIRECPRLCSSAAPMWRARSGRLPRPMRKSAWRARPGFRCSR